jgi:hypothetical protein
VKERARRDPQLAAGMHPAKHTKAKADSRRIARQAIYVALARLRISAATNVKFECSSGAWWLAKKCVHVVRPSFCARTQTGIVKGLHGVGGHVTDASTSLTRANAHAHTHALAAVPPLHVSA